MKEETKGNAHLVSDHRLQGLLKKYIRSQRWTDEERKALHGLLMCGHRIIHQQGALPAVFVVTSNSEESSPIFYGVATCRSPWSCPHCSARVMAQKGRRIAAAIEALKAQGQSAIMITFTMPHTHEMSCAETLGIFKNVWRRFVKASTTWDENNRKKKYTVASGEVRHAYKSFGQNPYGRFRYDLNITHHVKVYEATHGKNSWHPHVHMLLWVPDENFDRILDYEERLNERWWQVAKRAAAEFWSTKEPDTPQEEIQARVEELFSDYKKTHPCVTISKDKDGKPRKIQSSYYISGWSGNDELTALTAKKAQAGHLNPFQMLQLADEAESWEEAQKYLKLYTEYAIATRGTRRCEFSSRSGINQIIDKWLAENPTAFIDKKKSTVKGEETKRTVVCWFSEQQWSSICWIEFCKRHDIKYQILLRAMLPNAKEEIEQFLLEYDIDIRNNGEHHLTSHLVNKVLKAA